MRDGPPRSPNEPPRAAPLVAPPDEEQISLCELLDRVLNKGVVVRGDIVITVADIELLYLGVQLVLSSTETARRAGLILPHDMTRTMQRAHNARVLGAAAGAAPGAASAADSDPRPASEKAPDPRDPLP